MAFSLSRLFARVRLQRAAPGVRRGALTAAQARLLRDLQPTGLGVLHFGIEDASVRVARGPSGAAHRPARVPPDA